MSGKTFVFAADRHGRDACADGDIYIGAGDEIYAVSKDDSGEGIEDFETGVYGNASSQEEVMEYAAGELEERFEKLEADYEEAYLALGNHEDHLVDSELVKKIAEKYDKVHVKEDELVEIEGRNFYFGEAFQTNPDEAKLYDQDVEAGDAGYEEDELEAVGEVLGKEASEVNCKDINSILDGEVEQEAHSRIREILESAPLVGNYFFKPVYSLKDRLLGKPTETVTIPGLDRTEQHEQIEDVRQAYDEMIQEKVDKIDSAEGEVTYVTHGQPQTEEMPNANIEAREILERAENIGTAYVGHFHGGFNGDPEKEIGGTKVINPMEGYTIDESGGALQNYETHRFQGDPIAEADPVDLPDNMGLSDLTDEEQQKAQEIIRQAQNEASSQQEMLQIVQRRMSEEGLAA